ncbi:hypothetical protein JN11_03080 [Mucilaginibacter frigoritolerans]|jgi:hypothetical protein|uniref:Uncharacterized protein n=1 Tax=Mucilaginibacter frigoritolerans TaxID=652788 RepID=A0A562TZ28_9SPHI|nr:hypothetical protein [Mucilaginibacter frigoritolerans]TWI98891.1 hypothetical protein JN11_03080 [Mucilaginibacter frigoritolerans]
MKILKPILVALFLLLSGCEVTQYVSIPLEYSPKKLFKPGTVTVLLINQYDLSVAKNYTKRKLAAIQAGAYSSLKYAETQLKQLPNTKTISLVDSTQFAANTDSIKLLAAKYHADYVLALNKFTASVDLDNIDNSTAYYNSSVQVEFILYEGDGVHFKKLNGQAIEAQPETPYMGLLGSLVVHPTVGGSKATINIAAQNATQNALQDYLPNRIVNQRPLYNDEIFGPAIKEILASNFDKADTLLKPFLKDVNTQIVSRAAYNLAVVYEGEGDVDLAIYMANLSLKNAKNDYATNLLGDLEKE